MANEFLGLDFDRIVAGCIGGLGAVYALRKPASWELIAGLVVGGGTANYLTPSLATLPVLSSLPILAVAFIVGAGGKFLMLLVLEKWKAATQVKE